MSTKRKEQSSTINPSVNPSQSKKINLGKPIQSNKPNSSSSTSQLSLLSSKPIQPVLETKKKPEDKKNVDEEHKNQNVLQQESSTLAEVKKRVENLKTELGKAESVFKTSVEGIQLELLNVTGDLNKYESESKSKKKIDNLLNRRLKDKHFSAAKRLSHLLPNQEALAIFIKKLEAVKTFIIASDARFGTQDTLLSQSCEVPPFASIIDIIKRFKIDQINGEIEPSSASESYVVGEFTELKEKLDKELDKKTKIIKEKHIESIEKLNQVTPDPESLESFIEQLNVFEAFILASNNRFGTKDPLMSLPCTLEPIPDIIRMARRFVLECETGKQAPDSDDEESGEEEKKNVDNKLELDTKHVEEKQEPKPSLSSTTSLPTINHPLYQVQKKTWSEMTPEEQAQYRQNLWMREQQRAAVCLL